jgi:uncharacterized protein (TIGR02284 family)
MTSEKVTRTITDLLTLNHTSQEGYETAAEHVSDANVKSHLSQFAQQRAQFASTLEGYGSRLGIQAEKPSTVEAVLTEGAAAVHRGWINLKSLVTGGDTNTNAILGECENGDATALKAYETALAVAELPQDLKSVLQQQHSQILQAKNQVTALKSE